jgi:hypothetical protein
MTIKRFLYLVFALPLTAAHAQSMTVKDGAYHFEIPLPPALQECKDKAKPIGNGGFLAVCKESGWRKLMRNLESLGSNVTSAIIYDSTGELLWPSSHRSAAWKASASALGDAAPFGKRFFQAMPIEHGFYQVFFGSREDNNFGAATITIPHPQPDGLPASLKTPQFQQCKDKAKPVGKEGSLGVCERSESGLEITRAIVYDSTDEVMLAYPDRSEAWKQIANSLDKEAPFGIIGFSVDKRIADHYYAVIFQNGLPPNF